ncbi:MAG: NAD+ synthase, partial [Bifidobacteriaceae bacterium]|nr:NAD+ synthase [Bifidobacteriaceae bacterium]
MAIRAALAQIDPTVGDLEGNSRIILERAGKAAARGANLILFPEMALTGYPIEDLALSRSFQRGAAQALENLARDLARSGADRTAVIVGSLGTRRGAPTNIAAVLRGGKVEDAYVKHRLPNYGVFDE